MEEEKHELYGGEISNMKCDILVADDNVVNELD
ncbi:hypothetical protein WN943_021770 [Citrus x changshan-huyou]